MQRIISRRVLIGGTLGISSAVMMSRPLLASSCSTIEQIIARAGTERTTLATWASGSGRTATLELTKSIAKLENDIRSADDVVDKARLRQIIGYINTVGSLSIFIVGLSVGGSTALLVFSGSVFFAGGILIADALASPASADAIEIARDVSLSRVGTILETAGDDAFVASSRASTSSAAAGKFLGLAGTAFTAIDFAKRTGQFQRATIERQKLEEALAQAKTALQSVSANQALMEMRVVCLKAIEEEFKSVALQTCPAGPP